MAKDKPNHDLLYVDGPRRRWVVRSSPPPGGCRVLNIWFDPDTQKFTVEIDDRPIDEK